MNFTNFKNIRFFISYLLSAKKSPAKKIFGISLDLFAFRQKNLRIAPK